MILIVSSITGLAIAATLPKHYDITIIARDLPGDPDSTEWSSPWAGAIWLGLADSTEAEQKMQLDALAYWWQLALRHPESSARRVQMLDIMDHIPMEDVWYRNKVPGFRTMTKEELPADAHFGVTYGSIVLTPSQFLPWIRQRLEATGVKFMRANVKSLSELRGIGHDVLINATGAGPKFLADVKDDKVQQVRGQTVLVKSSYDKCWVRRGDDYTYCLSRGDGTCVLGGIKQYDDTTTNVDPETRNDVSETGKRVQSVWTRADISISVKIYRRVHENLPDVFPSGEAKDFELVKDIVGIRPSRKGGVRLEKEIVDGQKVVHAYGVAGGGYVFSWGLAREAVKLVAEFDFAPPTSAKL